MIPEPPPNVTGKHKLLAFNRAEASRLRSNLLDVCRIFALDFSVSIAYTELRSFTYGPRPTQRIARSVD